jgi:hypothetical protein
LPEIGLRGPGAADDDALEGNVHTLRKISIRQVPHQDVFAEGAVTTAPQAYLLLSKLPRYGSRNFAVTK